MTARQLTRIALHLLLAAFLVIPGIAAPAQGVASELQAAASAAMADGMADADMPCDQMGRDSAEQAPCDCCTPHACDFSACLGTGCLPELPRLVAAIPPVVAPVYGRQPPAPAVVIETPFRPPIA